MKRNEKRHLLEKVLSDCVGRLAAMVDVIGEWNTACWTIPPDGKTSDELKLPLSIRGRFTFVYRCPISLVINPWLYSVLPSRAGPSFEKIDRWPCESDILRKRRSFYKSLARSEERILFRNQLKQRKCPEILHQESCRGHNIQLR